MSVEKLRLICLVWPDDNPDEHCVEVELDNNRTVMFLKELIKLKHANMLDKVAARDLVLWKCSGLPDDDNLEQTLRTLQFDGSDLRLVRLVRLASARRQISQYFKDEDLFKEPIHILFEVPSLVSVVPHLLFNAEGSCNRASSPAKGEHACIASPHNLIR